MDTGLWNRITMLDLNYQLAVSVHQREPTVEFVGLPLAAPHFAITPPDPVLQPPSPPSEAESGPDIWYLQAKIFQFQHVERVFAVYVAENDTPDAIARTIMEQVDDDSDGDRFVDVVQPQPPGDSITSILTSTWVAGYGMHVAFVDARGAGGGQFVTFVAGYLTRDIIRSQMGIQWQPDFRVFAGISNEPLQSGDVVPTFNGMLVRIHFPGYAVPEVQWLEERMIRPDAWARNIVNRGLSEPETSARAIGLLGYWAFARVLQLQPGLTGTQLYRIVHAACGFAQQNIVITPPESAIPRLTLRGMPVSSVLGVHPGQHMYKVGFFVDARDLGITVRYVWVDPRRHTLDELFEVLSTTRPDGWDLEVTGASNYDPVRETFLPSRAAVITVRARAFQARGAFDDGLPSPDDFDEATPDAQDETDDEELPRSRTPRQTMDGASASHDERHVDLHTATGRWICTTLETATKLDGWNQVLAEATSLLNGDAADGRPILPLAMPSLPASGGDDDDAPTPSMDKWTISIADALGPMVVNCDVQSARFLPNEVGDNWRKLLQPWPLTPDTLLQGGPLHANTVAALQLCVMPDQIPGPRKVMIYTDGSAKGDSTGWAAALILASSCGDAVSFLGAFGGEVSLDTNSTTFVGATAQDSRQAEITAVIWATLWCISHAADDLFQGASINFDCLAAGLAASGEWSASGLPVAEKARHLVQFAESWKGMSFLEWRHVKAHHGHPWNELANTVANWFSSGCGHCTPTPGLPVSFPLGTIDISRLHMIAPGPDSIAFPRMQQGVANWELMPEGLSPLRPEQIARVCRSKVYESWTLRVKAITVNLQSAVGKCQYVEQQCVSDEIAIAFLQETKLPAGMAVSNKYRRFHSESDKHWGTAVWIAKDRPLGYAGEQAIFPEEDSFSVVAQQPRCICVTFQANKCKFCVMSLHFPHQSRPQQEIDAFNATVQGLLAAHKGMFLVAGVDANARVPVHVGNATGGRQFGRDDDAGLVFATLVDAAGGWIPSTFDHVHDGTDATYTHHSGAQSRIDFFVLDKCLQSSTVSTWVDERFDTVCENDDHFALCMKVQSTLTSTSGVEHRCRARKYDARLLRDDTVRAEVARRIQELPPVAWHVDVNDHAQFLQDSLQSILQQVIPWSPSRPRANHITEFAWNLRQKKQHFRSRTANRRRDHRRDVLHLTWLSIATRAAEERCCCLNALRKVLVLKDVFAAAISFGTWRMKNQIRHDKAAKLEGIAASIAGGSPGDIMSKAKSLGLGRRRPKRCFRHLPAMLMPSGSVAAGRHDLDQLWLQHFCKQEAGEIVEAATFFQDSRAAACRMPFEVDIGAVPTRLDLERILRQTKAGRAPGLDEIPGELLRFLPAAVSQAFFPLIIKATLHATQPTHWRGGVLCEAWKGSGSFSSAENFRSLFVGSALGKAHHRLVRERLSDLARQFFDGCHAPP